jgi:hypothetical protein
MANSPRTAVAALEVYETLWKRSATSTRIDLIQQKARLAELLAEQPSRPVPYLADHL